MNLLHLLLFPQWYQHFFPNVLYLWHLSHTLFILFHFLLLLNFLKYSIKTANNNIIVSPAPSNIIIGIINGNNNIVNITVRIPIFGISTFFFISFHLHFSCNYICKCKKHQHHFLKLIIHYKGKSCSVF